MEGGWWMVELRVEGRSYSGQAPLHLRWWGDFRGVGEPMASKARIKEYYREDTAPYSSLRAPDCPFGGILNSRRHCSEDSRSREASAGRSLGFRRPTKSHEAAVGTQTAVENWRN